MNIVKIGIQTDNVLTSKLDNGFTFILMPTTQNVPLIIIYILSVYLLLNIVYHLQTNKPNLKEYKKYLKMNVVHYILKELSIPKSDRT